MKSGDDGAVSASSLLIVVYLISERNKEKEKLFIFSLSLSDIKWFNDFIVKLAFLPYFTIKSLNYSNNSSFLDAND